MNLVRPRKPSGTGISWERLRNIDLLASLGAKEQKDNFDMWTEF